MHRLSFLCRLEDLGMTVDPSAFEALDKGALVEGVWRAHGSEAEGLLLIADLCLYYKVIIITPYYKA